MKFEQQLECLALPKFRGYYLNYKELKKAVDVFTGQERDQSTVQEVTHWTSSFLRLGPNPEVPPEAKLREILERELERVSKFADMEANAIRTNLTKLEAEAESTGRSGGKETLIASLDALGDQIVDLKGFALLNFTGFRKILKKYDKWSQSSVLPWFMAVVVKSPLMAIDFDGFIRSVNHYSLTIGPRRVVERARSKPDPKMYGDLTYLVDPQEAMRVRVELAKRLTLAPESLAPRSAAMNRTRARTSVVYFDTPDLGVYGARVVGVPSSEETEGAMAKAPCDSVCVRFGKDDAATVVAEVKGAPGQIAVDLKKSEVTQLFRGAAPRVADSSKSETLARVAQSVTETQLCPVVSATFNRMAFNDRDSSLKVVVEEEIKISNISKGASWDSTPAAGSEHFPYALLTISLAPGTTPAIPRWLADLDQVATLIQVSGFQLGIHAEAHFRARSFGLPMPHWYRSVMHVDEDHDHGSEGSGARADAEVSAAEAKQTKAQKALQQAQIQAQIDLGAAARLLHEFGTAPEVVAANLSRRSMSGVNFDVPAADGGSLSTPLLGGGVDDAETKGPADRLKDPAAFWEQQNLKPVRDAIVAVQPKTLFSNERTFLDWIHFAVMYAALGIAVGQSSERPGGVVLGRCLVLFAIFIAAWALRQFNRRADALDAKEIIDFSDAVGPPLFMGGLLVTLVFSTLHAAKLV